MGGVRRVLALVLVLVLLQVLLLLLGDDQQLLGIESPAPRTPRRQTDLKDER